MSADQKKRLNTKFYEDEKSVKKLSELIENIEEYSGRKDFKKSNFFSIFYYYIYNVSRRNTASHAMADKKNKGFTKETVKMTPNKSIDAKPVQTITVDLPYNSKVDLSSFSWFFDAATTHNGSSGATDPQGYVQTRFFPRNSASVIQKFTVIINGGIKIDIPDYNFLYNLLHDYTQGADALGRRQAGGESADPSNKLYLLSNDIPERRGYSLGPFDPAAGATGLLDNVLARDKGRYCVRSWLSLFG